MSIILRETGFDTLTCRQFNITQEKPAYFSKAINKAIIQPDHLQHQEICADCDGQLVSVVGAFMAISQLEQIVHIAVPGLLYRVVILSQCLLTKR